MSSVHVEMQPLSLSSCWNCLLAFWQRCSFCLFTGAALSAGPTMCSETFVVAETVQFLSMLQTAVLTVYWVHVEFHSGLYSSSCLSCLCCRAGLRTETSIVAETAQSFSTHHTAVLIGYGAHAVCPYLALETCRQWRMTPRSDNFYSSFILRNACCAPHPASMHSNSCCFWSSYIT